MGMSGRYNGVPFLFHRKLSRHQEHFTRLIAAKNRPNKLIPITST